MFLGKMNSPEFILCDLDSYDILSHVQYNTIFQW